MTDNSGRVIEIFTEASQLPTGDRSAFLDRACAGDGELRRKIEALLICNERAGAFLEQPPTPGIEGERAKAFAAGEKPGDSVGRYKLLKQIGEGGCGIVFLALQEEPIQRQVALKVIKPGMDTRSVIARFEAERQALALMDHPNIAHVFDAGATEGGRPYFVMELVDGVRITDYCDQHSLSVAARLELFVQVCDAIQHAHQKGIIHRDIKPSNVLVTTGSDGKAFPKVIDFGIAKATTGQQLADKTVFTAQAMLIGTPAYMSPEQAELASADVDTRSDIYSLGVLLYELLTGATPFDSRELLKAGIDEVRRVIREQEPVRPSARLSTTVQADLDHVSQHRQAEPPGLIRQVRGDLDWIVMTALEKDRKRRYQNAACLAEDIQRYLENKTVSARPPSRVYQFRKLISRHKLEFAAFGIVMTSLVAGLIITTRSLGKEKRAHLDAEVARQDTERERKKAELGEQKALTEAARSREATDFLIKMVFGAHPVTANGRDTSISREILDNIVTNLDRELPNQPAVRAEMKMWIGGLYINLGQGDLAEPLLDDALAYYRKSPKGIEAETKISEVLYRSSLLHITMQPRRLELAEREVREAIDIETKLSEKPSMQLVLLQTRMGYINLLSGKVAEAETIYRKALAEGEPLCKQVPDRMLDTRGGLAMALHAQRKFEAAEKFLRESISIARKSFGPENPMVANDIFRLAVTLEAQSKLEEAESLARQCVDLRRKTSSLEHAAYDESLAILARVLIRRDKLKDAADIYHELLAVRRKKFGDQDQRVAQAVDVLAEILLTTDNAQQFEQLAGQFPQAWATKSESAARRGQWSEALAAASKLIELRPDDHSGYHLMAPLLVQMQHQREYEELCHNIAKRFAGTTDPYTADRMAKDCLILPRPGADLKVPGELAETAVALGKKDAGALPFFQCCKALAEYRLENWTAAADWSERAARNSFPHSRAEALAIQAMAQLRLKHTDAARSALKQCDEILETTMPKLTDSDLGRDWRDLIIAHALHSEAKRLIEGESSSASTPANLQP
jgi:serine/threonine protein kinase